jgi:hypothetical protein
MFLKKKKGIRVVEITDLFIFSINPNFLDFENLDTLCLKERAYFLYKSILYVAIPTSVIHRSSHQNDGSSPLCIVGKTHLQFTYDSTKVTFVFEGLVVEYLDVDLLASIPFMEINMSMRPFKWEITNGVTIP